MEKNYCIRLLLEISVHNIFKQKKKKKFIDHSILNNKTLVFN